VREALGESVAHALMVTGDLSIFDIDTIERLDEIRERLRRQREVR